MISFAKGNLLTADVEALVNTVNTEGAMGKGIALQFVRAFPEILPPYEAACRSGELRPGKVQVIPRPGLVNPRFIINFPTKRHWRGKSRLADIEAGLIDLVQQVKHLGIRSIAVPPLGCGLGGLEWSQVRPRIEAAFAALPEVALHLYAPEGAPAPADQPIRTARPALTEARARVIEVLAAYLGLGFELSLLEVQKLLYFLQLAGDDLKLDYGKQKYGPYADNLRHVLSRFEGHYTSGYGEGRDTPDTEIELMPEAEAAAREFLAQARVGSGRDERMARVLALIEGFESPYGLELLASVHWVAANEDASTLEAVVERIHAWNERKQRQMPRDHIAIAWQRLDELGWLGSSPTPAGSGDHKQQVADEVAAISSKYQDLSKDELVRILERRDSERQLGLVWERDEIDPDGKINDDFVALDLDTALSQGDGPYNNLIIEGDNFDALRHLRMTHAGRIRCIYIDPPYNTGKKDFVYNDRFVDKTHRFRHSLWLEFLYPRLALAKELLAEDGVIVVSIDDNELFRAGMLLDRVFGEANKAGVIVWNNVTDNNPSRVVTEHEYVLCYCKNSSQNPSTWKASDNFVKSLMLAVQADLIGRFEALDELQLEYSKWFRANKDQLSPLDNYKFIDFGGIYAGSRSVHNPGKEGYRYDVIHPETGIPCVQPLMGYRFPEATMLDLLEKKRILFGNDHNKLIELKTYLAEYKQKLSSMIELDGRAGANELREIFPKVAKIFNNPKPTEFIRHLISFISNGDDTVLDFFGGSGTTAHAVTKLNAEDGGTRKFILVSSTEATDDQPDKNLCRDVCAERVRRVMAGYTNAKGEAVAGLGGNFAYLRAQRIPVHRLGRRLEHPQVWHALQMMHGLPLQPYVDAPMVGQCKSDLALAYLPDTDLAAVAAVTAWLSTQTATRCVVYSWSPARLHALPANVERLPIPDSLRLRFAARQRN